MWMPLPQGRDLVSGAKPLDAGKPWSHDMPAPCGVTRDQYPEPRPCAVEFKDETWCHLEHPYDCRRWLTSTVGIDWRVTP